MMEKLESQIGSIEATPRSPLPPRSVTEAAISSRTGETVEEGSPLSDKSCNQSRCCLEGCRVESSTGRSTGRRGGGGNIWTSFFIPAFNFTLYLSQIVRNRKLKVKRACNTEQNRERDRNRPECQQGGDMHM